MINVKFFFLIFTFNFTVHRTIFQLNNKIITIQYNNFQKFAQYFALKHIKNISSLIDIRPCYTSPRYAADAKNTRGAAFIINQRLERVIFHGKFGRFRGFMPHPLKKCQSNLKKRCFWLLFSLFHLFKYLYSVQNYINKIVSTNYITDRIIAPKVKHLISLLRFHCWLSTSFGALGCNGDGFVKAVELPNSWKTVFRWQTV